MTAPTLPETLARLAQLLPSCVRVEMAGDETDAWVYRYEARRRGWQTVWWGGDRPAPHDLDALEMALREECESRAWWWQVQSYDGGQWLAYVSPVRDEPGGRISTDSPAHALALAMISALGREGA